MTGPGIRGLVPGAGDKVMVGPDVLAGVDHPRWFRVTLIEELPGGALRLGGWFLGRDDLGELPVSEPFTFVAHRPAELIVQRADGGSVDAPPPAGRVAGVVEQLVTGSTEHPLPATMLDALRRPDHHRAGETDAWRWP